MKLRIGRHWLEFDSQYAIIALFVMISSVMSAIVWLEIVNRLEVEARWLRKPDVVKIEQNTSQFTLAWAGISHYDLLYRRRGESDWVLYETVRASSDPRVRVTVPDGEYEFAVRAVDSDGNRSPLHLSTDKTAFRTDGRQGGWYIDVQSQKR